MSGDPRSSFGSLFACFISAETTLAVSFRIRVHVNRADSSSVRSPLTTANATVALNAAEGIRRVLLIIVWFPLQALCPFSDPSNFTNRLHRFPRLFYLTSETVRRWSVNFGLNIAQHPVHQPNPTQPNARRQVAL